MTTKISSLLIANRGEIACRVITTAKQMGVRTIAVFSDADKNAQHVKMADEAHYIGAAPARESYLDAAKILDVAKRTKADAIHPGYGFLSENAAFAEACKKNKIIFVGPPASAITAMGLKDEAKALMQKAGVPVVPGYHGENQDAKFLQKEADKIGYPVLIKAVAGGGGKGMRRVDSAKDFAEALAAAQREAQNAFGEARVLIEKYITAPRHIEIQVFADTQGNTVYLFERDCSLQRRHQKVIEEAPAPGMTKSLRKKMGEAAVAAAKAVGYVGAGTVEFIADGSKGLSENGFFFMEMNTRLQVEHPVTEAITGLDLVELQLRVAAGETLPFKQSDLKINGHAVEARLYAEDPRNSFLPSTGKLVSLNFPDAVLFKIADENLRVDSGVVTSDEVTGYYDPMIAKLITHGKTREEALTRMSEALINTQVAGPKTNAAFLRALCDHPEFRKEKFDTGFIDKNINALLPDLDKTNMLQAGLCTLLKNETLEEREWISPWAENNAFQLSGARNLEYTVEVDGAFHTLSPQQHNMQTISTPHGVYVLHEGNQLFVMWPDPEHKLVQGASTDAVLKAPMNGKVSLVLVKEGDAVKTGDKLVIVEAMKMEHAVLAPRDGMVAQVFVAANDQVTQGAGVVEMEAAKVS